MTIMSNAVLSASFFLVNSLLGLVIYVFLLRFLLVLVHADFFNPITQFISKLTQGVIKPLRRILPNFRQVEFASLLIVLLIEMLRFTLLGIISSHSPKLLGLLVLGFADTMNTVVTIWFYAILLQVILSWIQPGFSPVGDVLRQITWPIIRPFQRIIPRLHGMDLSPIPAMLALQLYMILCAGPLMALGQSVAF